MKLKEKYFFSASGNTRKYKLITNKPSLVVSLLFTVSYAAHVERSVQSTTRDNGDRQRSATTRCNQQQRHWRSQRRYLDNHRLQSGTYLIL